MARGADSGRARTTTRGRRVTAAVALLALGVLLAASFGHLTHDHPHRAGQELSCAVCQTPVGGTPTAPALAPPTLQPAPVPLPPPAAPLTARAPLSFSPKQSPPPAA
jgi:hypothetical protein